MRRIPLRLALVVITGIVMTTAPVHDTFADEPATLQTTPDAAPTEPSTPAPGPEGSGPPPEAGAVQERAVPRKGELLELQGTTRPAIKPPGGITPTAPTPTAPSAGPTGPAPVVGGTFEPDYKYPWVVRMNGCGAVLIDPQWVLTAAHCVTPNIGFGQLIYTRTDPYTGTVSTETRARSQSVGPANNRGVFIHPNYAPSNDQANDIALIKLEKPFNISPYLQTVGLPKFSRNPVLMGTVASTVSHTGTTPAGQLAIFRGPIAQLDSPTKLFVQASATGGALCPGDSGSGFVTVEYGRATVRGVASQGTVGNCMTPSGEAVFTDIFAFRGWILQTMGKSEASLVGNTRLRWGGRVARGTMQIDCPASSSRMGPLNVVGVEEGTACDPGQSQTISCSLDANQGATGVMMTPVLSGITIRTFMANGTSQVQTTGARVNNLRLHETFPAGAVAREYTCQIGTAVTSGTIGGVGGSGGVLSRSVEGEQPSGEIVEQPSPFDPTEGTRP